MAPLVTIAEVPEFVRRAGRLLSAEERMALLEYSPQTRGPAT